LEINTKQLVRTTNSEVMRRLISARCRPGKPITRSTFLFCMHSSTI